MKGYKCYKLPSSIQRLHLLEMTRIHAMSDEKQLEAIKESLEFLLVLANCIQDENRVTHIF